MKYYRNGNFIFWVGEGKQFYFFVGKGKTRVGGSVNHGIKNSSPNWYGRPDRSGLNNDTS